MIILEKLFALQFKICISNIPRKLGGQLEVARSIDFRFIDVLQTSGLFGVEIENDEVLFFNVVHHFYLAPCFP